MYVSQQEESKLPSCRSNAHETTTTTWTFLSSTCLSPPPSLPFAFITTVRFTGSLLEAAWQHDPACLVQPHKDNVFLHMSRRLKNSNSMHLLYTGSKLWANNDQSLDQNSIQRAELFCGCNWKWCLSCHGIPLLWIDRREIQSSCKADTSNKMHEKM